LPRSAAFYGATQRVATKTSGHRLALALHAEQEITQAQKNAAGGAGTSGVLHVGKNRPTQDILVRSGV
jgi:hypothetical protein